MKNLILAVILIITALFTLSIDIFAQDQTPVIVKVGQNINCANGQVSAYVTMYYIYQGQQSPSYNGYTGSDGVIGFSALTGSTVYVTATYGGHTGVNCGNIVPPGGLNLSICLNDVNCCLPLPNDNLFCYEIR